MHSAYNPRAEALDVIKAQQEKYHPHPSEIRAVIMLGAALGYEIRAVRALYPNAARICAFFFHPDLYKRCKEPCEKFLYPNEGTSQNSGQGAAEYARAAIATLANSLLEHEAAEDGGKHIAIIQWPPSALVFAKPLAECAQLLHGEISRAISERGTAAFFMRQWISNAAEHYLRAEAYRVITRKSSLPAVVLAAGPSVADHLPAIRAARENFLVLATSSALTCAHAHGVYPDIVVHQDSGYYAARHIDALIDTQAQNISPKSSSKSSRASVIAMPLTASRSAVVRDALEHHPPKKNKQNSDNAHQTSPILLNTNQEPEHMLAAPHFTRVGAYATVAGTALDLAWQVTDARVYLAGFDLSVDIRGMHCLPHASRNSALQGLRTESFESLAREGYLHAAVPSPLRRLGMSVKQTPALAVYARWFSGWQHPEKRRTFIAEPDAREYDAFGFARVASAEEMFASVHLLDKTKKTGSAGAGLQYKVVQREPYEARLAALRGMVRLWKKICQEADSAAARTTDSAAANQATNKIDAAERAAKKAHAIMGREASLALLADLEARY